MIDSMPLQWIEDVTDLYGFLAWFWDDPSRTLLEWRRRDEPIRNASGFDAAWGSAGQSPG